MNVVDVKDIRTDFLIGMMDNLHRKIWKIEDIMELIQKELNRRERVVVG